MNFINEKLVFIESEPGIMLEALIGTNSGNRAVLLAHPHPLYGGNMYNNVVESMMEAYFTKGYTTIRFNFRGVGQSSGFYDNGVGERHDLKSVFNYIIRMGKSEVAMAGYSFGAWIIASCLNELDKVDHVTMVSPPVSVMDFSFIKYDSRIKLIITGSQDEIAPMDLIETLAKKWNSNVKIEVIEGADHFYWGITSIKDIIQNFLEKEYGL